MWKGSFFFYYDDGGLIEKSVRICIIFHDIVVGRGGLRRGESREQRGIPLYERGKKSLCCEVDSEKFPPGPRKWGVEREVTSGTLLRARHPFCHFLASETISVLLPQHCEVLVDAVCLCCCLIRGEIFAK